MSEQDFNLEFATLGLTLEKAREVADCPVFEPGVIGEGDCCSTNHWLCYYCKNMRFKSFEERENYLVMTKMTDTDSLFDRDRYSGSEGSERCFGEILIGSDLDFSISGRPGLTIFSIGFKGCSE